MTIFKSAFIALTISSFSVAPSFATDARKVAAIKAKTDAANATISQARTCDDNAAQSFSQLAGEAADAVASASFDKCRDLWIRARREFDDAGGIIPFTDAEMKENSFLLSTWLTAQNADADRNSLDAWKHGEIDRLRPIVMDARLKTATKP